MNAFSFSSVRLYNQRGTAAQWIKEGKNAVKWTRLSCHDFVENRLANLWGRMTITKKAHPGRGQDTKWDMSPNKA